MAEPTEYTKRGMFTFTPSIKIEEALIIEVQSNIDWSDKRGFVGVDTSTDPELEAGYVKLPTWGKINDEIVEIVSLVDDPGGAGQTIVLNRGILDTVPQEHIIGAILWFAGDWISVDPTEWIAGETVWAKAALLGSSYETPLDKVVPMPLAVTGLAALPYPPGNFQINGLRWPPGVVSNNVVTTWAHRDRLQQTAPRVFFDQTDSGIGPEAGTTYTIRYYDKDEVLRKTVTGLTGETYTWDTDEMNLDAVSVEILQDSPIGFWKLDETTGTTLADASTNANDATAVGSPDLTATAIPDGSTSSCDFTPDDYLSAPHITDYELTTTMSFEVWLNKDTADWMALIHAGNYATAPTGDESGFCLYLYGGGIRLTWGYLGTLNSTGGSGISAGVDTHVVVTADYPANQLKLYVDGALNWTGGLNPAHTLDASTIEPLTIGAQWALSGIDRAYNGTMDYVALYDYVLSPERVLDHYDSGQGPEIRNSEVTIELESVRAGLTSRQMQSAVITHT